MFAWGEPRLADFGIGQLHGMAGDEPSVAADVYSLDVARRAASWWRAATDRRA